MFIGTLSIYDAEPTEKSFFKMEGTNEVQLAYSYNGHNWYRTCRRETFIGRTEPGTLAGGSVYAGLLGAYAGEPLALRSYGHLDRARRLTLNTVRRNGRSRVIVIISTICAWTGLPT